VNGRAYEIDEFYRAGLLKNRQGNFISSPFKINKPNITNTMYTQDDIMELFADDQMKHAEAPSSEEMDEMYDAMVGSASEEYQNAH
jgi:hypothetical protein